MGRGSTSAGRWLPNAPFIIRGDIRQRAHTGPLSATLRTETATVHRRWTPPLLPPPSSPRSHLCSAGWLQGPCNSDCVTFHSHRCRSALSLCFAPSPVSHAACIPPVGKKVSNHLRQRRRLGEGDPLRGQKSPPARPTSHPHTPGSRKSLQPVLVRKMRAHARRFPPDRVGAAGAENGPEARTPGSKPARAAL